MEFEGTYVLDIALILRKEGAKMQPCKKVNHMKKVYVFGVIFGFSLAGFAQSESLTQKNCLMRVFPQLQSAGQLQSEYASHRPKEDLIKLDGRHEFAGLTPAGLAYLKVQRDNHNFNKQLAMNKFKQMQAIDHVADLVDTLGTHALYLGSGGSNKSGHVDHRLNFKPERAFKIMMHQMLPESVFIGGATYDSGMKGKYEINVESSLAASRYGVVDEADQGTPQLYASLFKILENPPQVWAGSSNWQARIRSVYFTMNANLAELKEQFVRENMASKFPAFMMRVPFKVLTHNWLGLDDRADLHESNDRTRRLQRRMNLVQTPPQQMKQDQSFLKPKPVDYEFLQDLAAVMFRLSDTAEPAYLQFTDQWRQGQIEFVRTSEQAHHTNRQEEPYVKVPTADLSTRTDLQFLKPVIEVSALYDFLESPLASDDLIERYTSRTNELDALSLWRLAYIFTMVGNGEIQLNFDPNKHAVQTAPPAVSATPPAGSPADATAPVVAGDAERAVTLSFSSAFEERWAKNVRERTMFRHVREDQDLFKRLFYDQVDNIAKSIRVRSQNVSTFASDATGESFEIDLILSRNR